MDSIHLLLVDDEKAYIEALARRLEQRQYSVDCDLSGPAALERLDADDTIDVVLLDIQMPGMDGIETLNRIKARHPLVEVIMLTGHATIKRAVDSVASGVFDFLEKPCALEALIEKADRAAARKRDRASRIHDVRTTPYISDRERQQAIDKIMAG